MIYPYLFLYIHKNQNGYYTIKNVGSNLYLGIQSDWYTMGNYSSLVQGVNASSKAGQFIFTRNNKGQWIISSAWDSRYVFDLNGAKLDNGNKVQLYTVNGSSAQAWKLLKVKNLREEMDVLAAKNKNTLSDGTYTIHSSINKSYVLDVNGGSKVNFGNIQLYQNNGTLAQGWKVSHDSKGYVTFINIGSGKAIDVKDGSAYNGQNISQYTSNNTYAQKWIVVQENKGFKIMSALNTSYVLDLNSALTRNYQNIQAYKSNDTTAQRWYFSKYESPREKLNNMAKQYNSSIEETTYVVTSYSNPNYVLDIDGGSKSNCGNLQVYKSNNTNAQKWKVKKDSVGYITFINVGSNKALDVSNASVNNGANIWQYELNNTYAQKWIAKKNTDGSLTFVSALDANYVLDINAGIVRNQQNIQLYQSNGTNAQKFKLTKI